MKAYKCLSIVAQSRHYISAYGMPRFGQAYTDLGPMLGHFLLQSLGQNCNQGNTNIGVNEAPSKHQHLASVDMFAGR